MENTFISSINDYKKYIDGLKETTEDIEMISFEEYDQEYKKICSNNSLSEVSKTFYLSGIRALYIFTNLALPFVKITTYIMKNRQSEICVDIFNTEPAINPILYPELYELLIQLRQKEIDNILMKMCLTPNTYNRVCIALKHQSEADFIAALETEKHDLTKVLKQLNVYYFLYNLSRLYEYKDFNNPTDLNLIKYSTDVVSEKINNEGLRLISEILSEIKDFFDFIPDDYSNDIENILYERNIKPEVLLIYVKKMFAYYYTLSLMIFEDVLLSDDELHYIRKYLYNNKFCNEFVEIAERYANKVKYMDDTRIKKICNDTEFVIPDDLFSNKAYTADSKEDEWIFFIDLDATDNIKKVQALQKFINNLAGYGYIENSFHVKATFLYRITGRKLPNTKLEIITWKDEMKNYNCFCYLVKNFEHDFLNRSMGNIKNGLYKKAQSFFGIVDKIDNPSAKANDTQKTKFNTYYEQFKKDMK